VLRALFRGGLLPTALVTIVSFTSASAQTDGATVRVVVLKEHGVGSQTLAQPYLTKFVAMARKLNEWPDATGQYFTSRSAADAFIQAQKPHYGILSLAALLALREKHHLAVIGEVAASLAGGRQYFLISKRATDLSGCKGKLLASDHTDDARYIDRVVAGGSFKLSDFTLLQTQRPLQTIKKVVSDEAACALIDDAQRGELSHIDGVGGIRTVWSSAELPPMAIVAFPDAPAAERARFQKSLTKVCDADGQSACAEVGIVSLKTTDATDYAAVMAAYDK
jgi:hypothetical protein